MCVAKTKNMSIIRKIDPFGFVHLNKSELSLLYVEIHKTLFPEDNSLDIRKH